MTPLMLDESLRMLEAARAKAADIGVRVTIGRARSSRRPRGVAPNGRRALAQRSHLARQSRRVRRVGRPQRRPRRPVGPARRPRPFDDGAGAHHSLARRSARPQARRRDGRRHRRQRRPPRAGRGSRRRGTRRPLRSPLHNFRPPSPVPSPAAFAASSRERRIRALARLRVPALRDYATASLGRGGYEIPAYAGMTVMARLRACGFRPTPE